MACYGDSWQPYRHLWADCLDNVESLTSHNPIGLHGLLQGIADNLTAIYEPTV
jgi:hypothetical protein